MKQEMNFTGYIDRYLYGAMSSSELNWFQKELEGNSELQEELRMQRKLNSLISDQRTILLQAQLEQIHGELFTTRKKITNKILIQGKKKLVYGSVAVATTCILLFMIITRQTSGIMDKNEIYTEYFKPAEIGMVFRTTENNPVNSDLRSAMVLYENRRYNEAIRIFEDILNKDSSRIGLNLYTGISHMEIEEYEEANKNFNKIIDHKANAFIESAQWYLGICYLMTDKDKMAQEVFTDISESTSYYKKEAKQILKKMNQ